MTTGNVLDMYKSIAWEFGLPIERSRASAHQAIRNEISRLVTEAKQLAVLVIDEAHHLRNDGLCCKPDVGVSQIRTTTVLSSCFCVGQTVL